MKAFFLRISLLLVFVLLQLSFFDILFPWFHAPLFLLGGVVVFTLIRGFPSSLFMTLPLTLFFDAASLGVVTWFSLYAVIFSYGTSFLSRRLLIEHRGLGLCLYALVSYGGVIFYQILLSFITRGNTFIGGPSSLVSLSSWDGFFFSLFFSIPIFIVTYFIVKRFEEYLDLLHQRQFLNVR